MPRLSVFRSRFFWKIYLTFAVLCLMITLLISWSVFYRVQTTIKNSVAANLTDKIAFILPQSREILDGNFKDSQSLVNIFRSSDGSRLTVINKSGQVVFDSHHDADKLENHLERSEVKAALKRQTGYAERYSQSHHSPMFYVAKVVQEGSEILGIVRIALPIDKIENDLQSLRFTIISVALAGVFVALGIGWALAKRVAIPVSEMVQVAEDMRRGRYDRKVKSIPDDELGRLGDTLNRLGSELTKQITELHKLETVRRDFVANVSHEIKTPLTSIKGYVETLLNGAMHDPVNNVRFLEKIDRNSKRLSTLVQGLLNLARIEAQEDSLAPTPTEWNPIINSVLARYEDTIHAKHLKIRIHENTEPLIVLGDKEAMTQVLDNLLTNAIKYTPEGGRISVTLSIKNRWGKLEVEDTGIGIPGEHLDRIFERFYRVDKARSRDLGGTGLGLSIVKHLVSGMQGDIMVESTVGLGSKFIVKLKMAA